MRYKLSFFLAFLLALTLAASAAPNRAVTTSGNLATTQTDINEELDELYEHTPASLDSFSGTNTYTASIEGMPALTSYDDGLTVIGKIPNTNTSTTISLNLDSLGAITVLDKAGSSIPVGGLASGTAYVFRYFASDNQFRVISQLTYSASVADELCIAVSDETTTLTTGTAKVTFPMPRAMTVANVFAYLRTAATGLVTIDINEDTDAEGAGASTTILSTKLTIDANERRSSTAATAPVISDSALAQHSEMTIDIDAIASGSPNGLKVCLIGAFS